MPLRQPTSPSPIHFSWFRLQLGLILITTLLVSPIELDGKETVACNLDGHVFVGDKPLRVCAMVLTVTNITYVRFVVSTAFPAAVEHCECVLERENEEKMFLDGWESLHLIFIYYWSR